MTSLVLLGILVFFPAAPSQATLPFGQTTLAPMLEKIIPDVVNIATRSKLRRQNNPLLSDPFFRHFFDLPDTPQRQPQSLGSGIIVDARRGLVLTNHTVLGFLKFIAEVRGLQRAMRAERLKRVIDDIHLHGCNPSN